MTKSTIKKFTFKEAVEYLEAANAISDGMYSVGTDAKRSTLIVPAGSIAKRPNGFFHRVDLNRLICLSKEQPR